jgi:hypothetical protein
MATFRLTVDIDADVKRESHGIAIKEGKQLREVVEQAMREYNARHKLILVIGPDPTPQQIKSFFAPLEIKDNVTP